MSLESSAVSSRQYSEAHQRALEVQKLSKLSSDSVVYVLSALPQPLNTTRRGGRPPGSRGMFSQSAGLTTERGRQAQPVLSMLCTRCPSVVKMLARFVLEYDPNFTFTTITINYNYASAPHHDVNHVDGHARIIALGSFDGGQLKLHHNCDSEINDSLSNSWGIDKLLDSESDNRSQTISKNSSMTHINDENTDHTTIIDIKDRWFDFDGRVLHSTENFSGERYSLVYFTHIAAQDHSSANLLLRLQKLGIPCPNDVCAKMTNHLSNNDMYSDENTADELTRNNIDKNVNCDLIELSEEGGIAYLLQPNIFKNQQYVDAAEAEISSLVSTYFNIDISQQVRTHYNANLQSENIDEDRPECLAPSFCLPNTSLASGSAVFPIRLRFPAHDSLSLPSLTARMSELADRAVTFTVWKEIFQSPDLESFRRGLDLAHPEFRMPRCHSLELFSYGYKLSTRQKRKVLMTLSLERSLQSNSKNLAVDEEHVSMSVLLRYNSQNDDACAENLRGVYLCHSVTNMSSRDKRAGVVQASNSTESTPLKPLLCRLMCNLAKVGRYSLCYDPFVGSGSLLHEAKRFGAVCVGSDVRNTYKRNLYPKSNDILSFCNEISESQCIESTFQSFDFFQANIYHLINVTSSSNSDELSVPHLSSPSALQSPLMLDAILCDAPYGRREKHAKRDGSDSAHHTNNVSRANDQLRILQPLLQMAKQRLRLGGRLVLLFMNYPLSPQACWTPLDLFTVHGGSNKILDDSTERLKVLHACREQWNFSSGHLLARDMIVFEKY